MLPTTCTIPALCTALQTRARTDHAAQGQPAQQAGQPTPGQVLVKSGPFGSIWENGSERKSRWFSFKGLLIWAQNALKQRKPSRTTNRIRNVLKYIATTYFWFFSLITPQERIQKPFTTDYIHNHISLPAHNYIWFPACLPISRSGRRAHQPRPATLQIIPNSQWHEGGLSTTIYGDLPLFERSSKFIYLFIFKFRGIHHKRKRPNSGA